ncbi:Clan MC, family M14, Zinc carboxypeptidase-like metallopeptidase [Tritrichomonas foetus]|uniref:Clan MC, family M14, Zinc carboxypeptidase-like metallopeptidase n=1 Tax=Tritrichomonas foetus TaxID=1144522 RepID=A0A1J4L1E0_9EUKA|nr:Clan MC, family M14, Zinc carboxypeptidase-like metallopeptidase [Tritrichomonas foetus]|eukprot:OHT15780.1 Clan MC, family M14, Zinc carboxypeptidase-like metallopeptidase [Tritrichomonas foetus]
MLCEICSMSSSSDSSADDEPIEFSSEPSLKNDRSISHPGFPNPTPATFAPIPKRIRWPDELWDAGTLIYSLRDPSCCLGPPEDSNDRVPRFDSKFESGNLMFAFQLSADTYHLILEYDHNNSGSCQWFYFEMSNVKKDIKYQFYISGFHKNSGVYKSGSKVFWYSVKQAEKNGISWSRGGSNYAYGVTAKKSKTKRSTLQFQMKFPYDDDKVYLCYALPYTYTQLKTSIINWKKSKTCNVTSSTLCTTLGGRDCPLLTITSSVSHIPESKRDCVFLTARIHPGESNGSYVIHGLIDFLVSSHPAATYLLESNIFKIVPMVNIDGVVEGLYRTGLGGVDLNRVWMNPEPSLHPVVCAIKELIGRIQKEHTIKAYVDFHGHSGLHGTFAYGCPNDDMPELKDKEKLFPRMVSYLTNAFSWGNCVFSFPKERKSASRIVMRKEFNIIQSFTVESSFGGISTGPRAGVLYDELIWKELGCKCGESLYHLLHKTPLLQFVSKEMSFLSPIATNQVEIEQPTDEDDSQPVDLQFSHISTETRREAEFGILTMNRGRGNGQPTLLKLRQPSTFLTANSRIISVHSPGYAAPKWAQMQFVPQ